jgi:dihydroorotate dehydrogenase (NAD+) catalytic subunit
MTDISVSLGPVALRTPLIGACGTIGSVVEFAAVSDLTAYGAAVAKSVSGDPWPGRKPPRIAPTGIGMLNGIGIQNPGVDEWAATIGPQLGKLPVPVWGSAVGNTAAEFARVAAGLQRAGVSAIEVNLSCPNLEGEKMFALDPVAAAEVVGEVASAVDLPIGAKLSPNSEDIVVVAESVATAGAAWVVLTNTAWGAGFDTETRRPLLSGVVGGYSGAPVKPLALRCVWEVSQAFPELPIVGCGGINSGRDVVEFMLAGASAIAIGTAHFAEPRAGSRILGEFRKYCLRHGVDAARDLTGSAIPWT